MAIAGEEPPWFSFRRAHKMILQTAVVGRCLTETDSTLAAADLVISDAVVRSREGESEISFALGVRTFEVNRREIWIKRDGQHVLVARWTHALVLKFPWIALPIVGEGFRVAPRKGFWRVAQGMPECQPDAGMFAQEVLELRLSLMDPDVLQPAQGDPISGP